MWGSMYTDDIVLVTDSGMELQTVGDGSSVCRKSKITVVGKREDGMSWKIGEEIMEEVEEFKYFGVWFDRKLRSDVHLEKMANKAEEWVGKVM